MFQCLCLNSTMDLEKLKTLGRPQQVNPYQIEEPGGGDSKKKLFLMVGGVILLLIALWFVLTAGGGSGGGQSQMKAGTEKIGNAVAILDEYNNDLSEGQVKNNMSQALIILRGSYQNSITAYKKIYKPKVSLRTTPRLNKKSKDKEVLDRAKRNNVLDSEIVTALKPIVESANKSLRSAKAEMEAKSARDEVSKIQTDLDAVNRILTQTF